MARRYRGNRTKEESLYVENRIDDELYTKPLDEEEEEDLSIYQRPDSEAEIDEEEEEEENEKKSGLFGLFRRKHQDEETGVEDDDEDDDEEEEEDDEDEEEIEKPRRKLFGFRKNRDNEDDDDDEEEEEEDESNDNGVDPLGEDKKSRFNVKIIAAIAVAAVVVIGGVVFIIRGLSGGSEGEAYVEEVKKIAGLGSSNGINNRYTGEVEPQSSWKVTLDGDLSVDKCYVKVGDVVKKGDKLFKYDTEELQLSYERQELEIETLKNDTNELNRNITTYQNDSKTASASEKIELQTQILTNQTQIKKNEFSIKSAEDQLKKLKAKIKDATVKSKMDGRIQTLNEKLGKNTSNNNSSDSDSSTDGDNTYMTILATGDFRVKGKINESNIASIAEGDPVIVRSRVNDDTWSGTISQIKTDSTVDGENTDSDSDYSDTTSGESTSNYNFYVSLTGDEGLMMGQHVFVELDNGQDQEQEGIWLPSAYLEQDKDDFYVWKDSRGKLKREKVKTGDYNEMLDTYQVLSGVEESDYIACYDDTLEQNMNTTKTEPKNTNTDVESDTGVETPDGVDPEDVNPDGTVG